MRKQEGSHREEEKTQTEKTRGNLFHQNLLGCIQNTDREWNIYSPVPAPHTWRIASRDVCLGVWLHPPRPIRFQCTRDGSRESPSSVYWGVAKPSLLEF